MRTSLSCTTSENTLGVRDLFFFLGCLDTGIPFTPPVANGDGPWASVSDEDDTSGACRRVVAGPTCRPEALLCHKRSSRLCTRCTSSLRLSRAFLRCGWISCHGDLGGPAGTKAEEADADEGTSEPVTVPDATRAEPRSRRGGLRCAAMPLQWYQRRCRRPVRVEQSKQTRGSDSKDGGVVILEHTPGLERGHHRVCVCRLVDYRNRANKAFERYR